MRDPEDLPTFEKVKRKTREVKHGKMNHYFRRSSCIGKVRFHSWDEAKTYREQTCNFIKFSGGIPDKTKIYECPFCKGFHTAHIEE